MIQGEPSPAPLHLSCEALAARLAPILARHGCAPEVARLLAENCAAAERDGAHSHGLFRMPGYLSTLKADGWVDGHAVPRLEDVAPGFLRIDGRNGFTVPALAAGRALALEKVRANGVAVVAIRNSHHLGALSLDVEPFAEAGLVALAFINSMKAVVPHGGHSAVYGTNPIAFATPRADGPPLVFDQASSVMANGDVQIAAREGRTLEPGVGVDRDGRPTTDPKAVLDGGALHAFGGYKGASLALMVEILCAALVGGKFSAEVDLSRTPGAATPHTGQSLILIDPNVGRGPSVGRGPDAGRGPDVASGGLPDFAGRVEHLLHLVNEAGQERLPGDRRHAARARSLAEGIALSPAMLDRLREWESA